MNDIITNQLGCYIKELRIAKGLTQKELGTLLGLKSPSVTVCQYELGRRIPKFEILEKMACVFETSFEQLCTIYNQNLLISVFSFRKPLELDKSMEHIKLFLRRFKMQYPNVKVECYRIKRHGENKVSHIQFCFANLLTCIRSESVKEFESLWQRGLIAIQFLENTSDNLSFIKSSSSRSDFKEQMNEINKYITKTWKE